MTTPRQRLLWLRVLALRNARIGYEPHRDRLEYVLRRGISRTRLNENEINRLAWRYRRQISPELVPFVGE